MNSDNLSHMLLGATRNDVSSDHIYLNLSADENQIGDIVMMRNGTKIVLNDAWAILESDEFLSSLISLYGNYINDNKVNSKWKGCVFELTDGSYLRVPESAIDGQTLDYATDAALSSYIPKIKKIIHLNPHIKSLGYNGVNPKTGKEPSGVRGCVNITDANIAGIKYLGLRQFINCANLSSVNCPDVETMREGAAFDGCKSLISVALPKITTIQNLSFANCTNLLSIDLTQCSAIPAVSDPNVKYGNIFEGANPNVSVLVPPSLYDEWLTSGNWKYYSQYVHKI